MWPGSDGFFPCRACYRETLLRLRGYCDTGVRVLTVLAAIVALFSAGFCVAANAVIGQAQTNNQVVSWVGSYGYNDVFWDKGVKYYSSEEGGR